MARFVEVKGTVEFSRAQGPYRAVAPNDSLCPGDRVRVRTHGRAALLLLSSETLLRLDQGTTVTLVPAARPRGTWLELLTGALHVITRTPQPFSVRTPFVNANVEGTEFAVSTDEQGSRVAVYEGRVAAEAGNVVQLLQPGQQLIAQRGAAPRSEPAVRLRDAVSWTLHVPTVVGPRFVRALPPGPARSALERAEALRAEGRIDSALAALATEPLAGEAAALAWRAAQLLTIGRIDEARPLLERVLAADPRQAEAHALTVLLALVDGDRERARALAERAGGLVPASAPLLLARSYVEQASFRIDAALADAAQAVALAPDDGLVLARLSELHLATGDVVAAIAWARRAVELDARLAAPWRALGFAQLAALELAAARESFTQATALDSSDPMPHLGKGLVLVRQGRLAEGRTELEVAAALDPAHSLVRSTLAKAYVEERRDALAAEQLRRAVELDPLDPTPHLYEAVRLQGANRPAEALQELQRSIELNGNRAVFRSQLLIVEDAAVRSASLARIYADLGFTQLALDESVKSLAADPANASAHAFLADHYLGLPRHEMARDSELLQAQLLQPLNARPPQPRLSGDGLLLFDRTDFFRPGANEYGRLLTTQGLRFGADAMAGNLGTRAASVALWGLGETSAFSIGHFSLRTDGPRPNADRDQRITSAFAQWALAPQTHLQFELRHVADERGDLAITFFDEDNYDSTLRDRLRSSSMRAGLRHSLDARTTVLVSYVYRRLRSDLDWASVGYRSRHREREHLLEVRAIHRGDSHSTNAGVGLLSGHEVNDDTFEPDPPITSRASVRHLNAYVYHQSRLAPALDLTVGASIDRYRDDQVDRDQVNPKVGLVWTPDGNTIVRLSGFRVLKRKVVSGQTIEPTNVAGFNQFYSGIEDANGTESRTTGGAVTRRLGDRVSLGAELFRRRVELPAATLNAVADAQVRERAAKVHAYWSPAPGLAATLAWETSRLNIPQDVLTTQMLSHVRTTVVPLQLRLFGSSGALASIRVSAIRQRGDFFSWARGETVAGDDRGRIVDLSVGWRLPYGRGTVAAELRNALDDRFAYQEINPLTSAVARRRMAFVYVQLGLD